MALQRHAAMVIPDSGGIQQETTFLGVPCLTVREDTERPITMTLGTNQLVGSDLRRLHAATEEIVARNSSLQRNKETSNHRVPLWDGHAAERIAQVNVRNSAQ
jgi:UDP-N-acetylglucosamine 2-epimerase (non-hydrolysing)